MSNTARVFSKKMVSAREAKGWSQQDLADRIGVSTQTIWTWEKGRKLCRTSRLEKLAAVLDRSPDWFYQEDEDQNRDTLEPKGFRGRMIAEARDDFSVTVQQLSQKIGRPVALVRSWESGEKEPTARDFEESIQAIESLGSKRPSPLLGMLRGASSKPSESEGETVEISRFWFERFVNFYDDMAKHIPTLEPVPNNLIELANYRKRRDEGDDCFRLLNEAVNGGLPRLFIEQAQGRLARAREGRTVGVAS